MNIIRKTVCLVALLLIGHSQLTIASSTLSKTSKFSGFLKKAGTTISTGAKKVGASVKKAAQTAASKLKLAGSKIKLAAQKAGTKLKTSVLNAKTKLKAFGTKVGTSFKAAGTKIKTGLKTAGTKIKAAVTKAAPKVSAAIEKAGGLEKIVENVQPLVQAGIEASTLIVNAVGSKKDILRNKIAAALAAGDLSGANDARKELAALEASERLPSIQTKLAELMKDSRMNKDAINTLQKDFEGIVTTISNSDPDSLAEGVTDIVTALNAQFAVFKQKLEGFATQDGFETIKKQFEMLKNKPQENKAALEKVRDEFITLQQNPKGVSAIPGLSQQFTELMTTFNKTLTTIGSSSIPMVDVGAVDRAESAAEVESALEETTEESQDDMTDGSVEIEG